MEARTIGARTIHSALAPGRHWTRDPFFGLPDFEDGAWDGSALVYFDSGNLVPPNGNLPPAHEGDDPHGHPRNDAPGGVQMALFWDTGTIVDTRAAPSGGPATAARRRRRRSPAAADRHPSQVMCPSVRSADARSVAVCGSSRRRTR